MADLSIDFSTTRPRACAFYAGRAWYAGVEAISKNGWVLFSQVATDTTRLAKCYQDNDPTSEIFSDLKDDDGGVIPIPDAGDILALKGVGTSLLVFASNGVWAIRGGDTGFKATDYMVEKISSSGAVGIKTIAQVDDILLYMAPTAIFAVKVDQAGIATIQNITDDTIKTYYESVPLVCKQHASATFNRTDRVVYFMYSDTDTALTTYGKFFKNTILKYDVGLKSFYIERITNGYPHIVSVANTTEIFTTTQAFDVVVGDDEVVANGYDVTALADIIDSATSQPKFLTVSYSAPTYSVTFSEYNNSREDFLDWGSNENSAYIITGYNMGGVGPVRQKTAPFITVFAKKTETFLDADLLPTTSSSIKMQTRWDFTDNAYPGKWSTEYEVYRQLRPYFTNSTGALEDGYPLVITKNKVRGRGRALQIKWSAGAGKDMQLVGWSVNFLGNQNV